MLHRERNSALASLVASVAAIVLLASCANSVGSSVAIPGLAIMTGSLPNGQVGAAYNAALVASGGTAPYSWKLVSGTLPAGLSFNSAGALSGTPTGTASANLTFRATDSSKPAQTRDSTLTLTIAPATLAITTASLANGQVGVAYNASLVATGGTGPYTWSITNGTLPAGLMLTPATGAITGTPTTAVSSDSVTFQVQDSENPAQAKTTTLSITIAPATLAITTNSLANGQVGVAYNASLVATGGTVPYTWSITNGSLPAGLTLMPATGAISGTPTAAVSNDSVTFQVQDSENPAQAKTTTLSITIAPATLAITTASLANGQVGVAYNASLVATGGTAPYTWSITNGSLPAGLSLNGGTGAITGTPTTAISSDSVTFQVKDAENPAQAKTTTLSITIAPATLAITTASLANGQVGVAYNASLVATGGTAPYTWSITNGSLPAGLTLMPATGAISGTPTAAVSNDSVTFQVQDSGAPQQTKTANLTLTITGGAANITVSVSPARAAVTVTQALSLTATTNDAAGVNWTINPSGGSFSAGSSLTGVAVVLTSPSSAGAYTVTATSVTNPATTSSITVAVTDLPGVYTYHNDLARDGSNSKEYALTTSTVATATFGKLFSCPVDGAVYAQPLWVANLAIGGTQHNVVFVATMHDSLFAFDADASPCVTLWSVSLIDAAHGGTLNETSVPGTSVGFGNGDVMPEIGITGTPVIDPATGTLYAVSKSIVGATFFQRLHAIDITTGNEKTGAPANISATYPGTGDGSNTVTFNPGTEAQRPGLVFANGNIYVAWASHEDAGPYYGWIIAYAYNGSSFSRPSVVNVTPNVQYGGIWMGGSAPAVDASGNLYVLTGNGGFDATSPTIPNNDYGDSMLELTSGLAVSQYFTPSDQQTDQSQDKDFGSGGAAILADLPAGSPVTHLVMGGGKDHTLYVLNRDALGGSGDANSWQMINLGHGIFATGAFWNNNFYIAGLGGPVNMYSLTTATALFSLSSSSTPTFGFPGSTPSVSSQGNSSGIVWALNNNQYCTNQSPGCGPAVLHAFDATNVATELWNSSMVAADAAGNAVKFCVPTVANGKVYVGTRGNNTGGADNSTSTPGELDVYGLKSN